MAAKVSTIEGRLEGVANLTGSQIVGRIEPIAVTNKRAAARFLGAAVYRVDRKQL